jgi:hypothetical protein
VACMLTNLVQITLLVWTLIYIEYLNTLAEQRKCVLRISECEVSNILLYFSQYTPYKRRALFTSKMDLKLRKKLVKCYIWNIWYMIW